ncbi:MAG: helix-turn-helix domain-containing protein [Bacillota bacterium]
MDLVRVGEKVISKKKINDIVEKILELRVKGLSQQEVANRTGIDRTFISRLETLGEIRKGRRIAVVGFPILNKQEIMELLNREGVDFPLVMTEQERWDFVRNMSGADLVNTMMRLIGEARKYDAVIIIGSDQRIKIIEAMLDCDVIGLSLGESPIEEDRYVDPDKIMEILSGIKR